MAGLIKITYEGRQSLSDIQSKFSKELSQKEILKSTAYALNLTASRVQAHIRKQVRQEYTVKNKQLMKMSHVSKKAAGSTDRLYANVSFSYKPIPMIAFKHTGTAGSKRPVSVTIKKGQTKTFRHAFIRVKKSGEQGIFSQGRYIGKKFTYAKDDKKATELKTASPYTMSFSTMVRPKINDYIAKELPGRLEALLKIKLSKMGR